SAAKMRKAPRAIKTPIENAWSPVGTERWNRGSMKRSAARAERRRARVPAQTPQSQAAPRIAGRKNRNGDRVPNQGCTSARRAVAARTRATPPPARAAGCRKILQDLVVAGGGGTRRGAA